MKLTGSTQLNGKDSCAWNNYMEIVMDNITWIIEKINGEALGPVGILFFKVEH